MTSALLVLMAALWVILAPTKFGGQASYVMVAGASMEPTLKRGDLVVVREAQTYEVGQIATYRHPTIGPIIHRIIDRQGDTYTFKGDNNDWIDSYQPASSEIIGNAWFELPGAANWLLKLRMPAGLALLSLSIAVMLMTTFAKKSNALNLKTGKEQAVLNREKLTAWASNLDGAFFALGAVAFASLLLGLFAFTRPLTVDVPADIPFEHHGQFEYHSGAPPSVYDGGKLVTGDPVFHQLVSKFELDFQYRLVSRAASTLHGTSSMSVQVSDPNGWRRTIELLPQASFNGPETTLSSTIDLKALLSLTGMLQERTGTQRQVYNVDIIPVIQISGSLDGKPFEDRFTPQLSFQLDELELYLRGSDPLSGNGNPLAPSMGGFLPRTESEPATISILGLDLAVETARWIAGVGFGLAIASILGLSLALRGISQRDRAAEIQIQYGPLLVEVEEIELKGGIKQTDVLSIDDLAKLAERGGGMILHVAKGDEHTYCVQVGETCYRFILLVQINQEIDRSHSTEDER